MFTQEHATNVLTYWYGPLEQWDRQPEASLSRHQFWWQGGQDMDEHIAATYGDLHRSVVASPDPVLTPEQSRRELAEQCLARIIILSQFTRHIHRGAPADPSEADLAHFSARAFEHDDKAREIARWMISEGLHEELAHYEKTFVNMAFIQSEDLTDQEHAVAFMREMAEIAIATGRRHWMDRSGVAWCEARRDTVRRFGRLPFRNAALGRESTADEVAFLQHWRRGMS